MEKGITMSPEEKERAMGLLATIPGLTLQPESSFANWVLACVEQSEKIAKHVSRELAYVVVALRQTEGVINIKISDKPEENDRTVRLLREALKEAA
jgi:histidinol-phosphate/aromatic aminotransferase/cobyric acid decarboxylase-like protein